MFHQKSIAGVGISLAALAGIGVVLTGCAQTSGGSSPSAMKKSSYVAPPAWEPPVEEKKGKRTLGQRLPFNLTAETLKSEVELSSEQTAEIDRIYADYQERKEAHSREVKVAEEDEDWEKLEAINKERIELRKATQGTIRKMLDGDQKKKLNQLLSGN